MSDKINPDAMERLTRELEQLNRHRFVRMYNSVWRMIGFQFLRGLAFGLGSVIGATLLVSMLVYWMSQLEFLPYIGEWVTRLLNQIEASRMGLRAARVEAGLTSFAVQN